MQFVGDNFAVTIFENETARRQLLRKRGLVELQQRRDDMGDGVRLIADERRIGTNRFHRHARGQNVAIRVENVAAPGCLPEFALRIVLRLRAQLVMPENLQIHQPVAQAGKRRAQNGEQQ